MKKFLACMLILTIVFPAYCFANLQETTPPAQEVMAEFDSIIEDGFVEKAEIENLMVTLDETGIVTPNQMIGDNCFQAIVLALAYLWLSIDSDGLEQITSIVFLIFNIGQIISQC
jgi:hypothetical protein